MVDLVMYGVVLVQDFIKSINLHVQPFEKKGKNVGSLFVDCGHLLEDRILILLFLTL